MKRPPWQHKNSAEHQRWRRHGRWLFVRLALSFGVMSLLVLGSMGFIAFLLARGLGGENVPRGTAVLVWLSGVLVAITLPLGAIWLAIRNFRRVALPLTAIMNAAEAVAQGDLTVHVAEQHPGDFGRLARTFNRMVGELALAEQRRRNLTADVAHELRTPLHIIQGNLEGILDEVYEPTAEHIQATLEETRLLARLVEDLRLLSQAEAGELALHKAAVAVRDLLLDVQTSFSGQAEAAGVQVVVDAPADLVIHADDGRLTQVLNNLMANALRHTAAGGQITLAAVPLTGGIALRVADTGEGIAPEALPYVFDRFWRGAAERPHTGSTGLGLAIARQLIQAHGGTIEVASTVGVGTTFTIELKRE